VLFASRFVLVSVSDSWGLVLGHDVRRCVRHSDEGEAGAQAAQVIERGERLGGAYSEARARSMNAAGAEPIGRWRSCAIERLRYTGTGQVRVSAGAGNLEDWVRDGGLLLRLDLAGTAGTSHGDLTNGRGGKRQLQG
jgi:hypothetical protein